MKSGSSGARHPEGDDDSDDGFETRSQTPQPPLKGGPSPSEFDNFDEEDFDDEFDDDFEEELEDEYELSEFGELTEEDLAEDDDAEDVPIGDFVDEDAEPEEPALEAEEEPAEEEESGGKKKKKAKGKGTKRDANLDDED